MSFFNQNAQGQQEQVEGRGAKSMAEMSPSFALLSEAISVFHQSSNPSTDESSESSNESKWSGSSTPAVGNQSLSFAAPPWPRHHHQQHSNWNQNAPYKNHQTVNNGFSHYQSSGAFANVGTVGAPPASRLFSNEQPAALQPRLLKQINCVSSKEELLQLISTSVHQLDDINLVTAVHRLAKISSFIKSPSARFKWTSELQSDIAFNRLLSAILFRMLNNQIKLMGGEEIKGLDSRCVSNLIWALVKLEVDLEVGSLGYEVIRNVSPLVIRFLSSSSSQGLANLLWAYSKMPAPLLEAMMLIVAEMAERLHDERTSQQFDAQALSNSIWALAHVRSKFNDLDAVIGGPPGGLTTRFMLGIAFSAMSLLRNGAASAVAFASRTFQAAPRGLGRDNLSDIQSIVMESEKRFSCQALVNIAWSFSSMLGEDVGKIPAISDLFLCIRSECLIRLNTTLSALSGANHQWFSRMQGGFNEQALSNVVYAYSKAQLLDRELLQLVYDVASLRLDSGGDGRGLPMGGSFKPQELCTLLRAAHTGLAQPWIFLSKLHSVVTVMPRILNGWSPAEHAEIDRAFALLDMYRRTLQQLQQQSAQQTENMLSHLALSLNQQMPSDLCHQVFQGFPYASGHP